ncbi:MAG TPA: hypothetical protein VFM19_08600 [Candidatus Limnocylindria bacterium]|nr:hypothetical protein [Candidatus Limnocylindria bacterium]
MPRIIALHQADYRLLFTLIAGHDRFHLTQAERALATIRGS